MIVNSLPARTIEFFVKGYPLLESEIQVSCTDLAGVYGCTPQAAAKHVRVLEREGYLTRVHYRAWELSSQVNVALKRLQYANENTVSH